MRLGRARSASMPPAFVWWRDFAARYVGHCAGMTRVQPRTPDRRLPCRSRRAADRRRAGQTCVDRADDAGRGVSDCGCHAGAVGGAECDVRAASLTASGTDLQVFLKSLNPAWNLLGGCISICRKQTRSRAPLRFHGHLHHAVIGAGEGSASAAGASDARIFRTGEPEQASFPFDAGAARRRNLRLATVDVDAGEIFHPLRWTSAEAARLLSSAPQLESAGVVLRMPAAGAPTDQRGRRSQPRLARARRPRSASTASSTPHGRDARGRAAQRPGSLHAARRNRHSGAAAGVWVEIDRERLERALRQFKEAEALADETV